MDKMSYTRMLRQKVRHWGKMLAQLEYQIGRAHKEEIEDHEATFLELMQRYETLELRLDEFDQMSDEEFKDERPIIDKDIKEFEADLMSAYDEVKEK